LQGDYWICHECGERFDMFDSQGRCPNCGIESPETPCPECGQRSPVTKWHPAVLPFGEQPKNPSI
jgi:DNA-directed RNA polymerase subunit RPC12/RpoP